jgi:transposase
MRGQPPLPQPLWDTLSAEAQAAVSASAESFERRIARSEERLGRNPTNSSRPPSSDPPSVKRPPPAPPSGKRRGGQPGHARQVRPLVPPERVRQVTDCKPPECRWCGDALAGDDPGPLRHQVAEVPPVRPVVDEYRLHRLTCPRGRTTTRAALPPGGPAGAFGPRLRAVLSVLAGADRLGKRPIRQLASDRKLGGGTDSERGSRFVERMLTAVATCRQRGVSVLDYLTRCYKDRLDGKAAPSLLPTTEPLVQ